MGKKSKMTQIRLIFCVHCVSHQIIHLSIRLYSNWNWELLLVNQSDSINNIYNSYLPAGGNEIYHKYSILCLNQEKAAAQDQSNFLDGRGAIKGTTSRQVTGTKLVKWTHKNIIFKYIVKYLSILNLWSFYLHVYN